MNKRGLPSFCIAVPSHYLLTSGESKAALGVPSLPLLSEQQSNCYFPALRALPSSYLQLFASPLSFPYVALREPPIFPQSIFFKQGFVNAHTTNLWLCGFHFRSLFLPGFPFLPFLCPSLYHLTSLYLCSISTNLPLSGICSLFLNFIFSCIFSKGNMS